MEGTVRWFSNKLGYGFIISPGVEELTDPTGRHLDVFAHHTKIQMEGFRKLEPEEGVTYDLIWVEDKNTGKLKPQAENIHRQGASE